MKTSHFNFVQALLADPAMNATRAYLRVFSCNRKTAEAESSRLLQQEDVKAALEEGKAARLKRLELTQDDVLRDVFLGVQASGEELANHVVDCCRHCYGEGFRYMLTPAEFRSKLESYLVLNGKKDPHGFMFLEEYGTLVGFDPRKPPRDDCPECFGRGVATILAKDTRYLTEAGRRQYAGVKMTKNGPELVLRSRDKALEIAAKHTGVARENIKLETVKDLSDEELAKRVAQAEHKLKQGKKP